MNEKNTDEYLAHLRDISPYELYVGQTEEGKHAYLRAVAEMADPQYDWAEFGVENGTTARIFHEKLPNNCFLYLFDSFLGLPEDWVKGDPSDPEICEEARMLHGLTHPAGAFKTVNKPSFEDSRVVITEGWFIDTLPRWAADYKGEQLGLIHIDCDLYSSAKTVYENVGHLMKSGTIILFDELTKNHDKKAFMEFLSTTNNDFEYIAAVRGRLQVAVRIL